MNEEVSTGGTARMSRRVSPPPLHAHEDARSRLRHVLQKGKEATSAMDLQGAGERVHELHTDTVLKRLMNMLAPQPARQPPAPLDLTIPEKKKAPGADGTVLEVETHDDRVFVKTDQWQVTFTFKKDIKRFADEFCSISGMRAFKHINNNGAGRYTDGTKITAKVGDKEYRLGTEVVPKDFIAGFKVMVTKMTVDIAP